MFDFAEIGKKIAGIGLPLLGGAIGGPGGAALAGLVSSALGLTDSSPDAISAALQSNPDAAIKLKELQLRHTEMLEGFALKRFEATQLAETAQQAAVNATMQAELGAEGAFKTGWRPLFGYMAALGFGGLLTALIAAIFREPATASSVIESATVILTMMLGVLGVNIRSRSQDKQSDKPNRPLGIFEAVANRIAK